jgi:cyanophycinase
MAGLLVLNGGDEFRAGNEPQDRELVSWGRDRPAYVVPTAAARQRPDLAVATASRWFAALGLEVVELPVLSRKDAQSNELASMAAGAGLFYLTGGDPGLTARVLRGSRVWEAMRGAWLAGAGLAGSSAGAMVMCSETLVMDRWPRHHVRRPAPALGVVPGAVVIPHYERFGGRWELPAGFGSVVIGIDERTAAVWDGEGWRAAGAGAVTVVFGAVIDRFPAGSRCDGIPSPVATDDRIDQ